MENFEALRQNVLIDVIPTFFMGVRSSKNCEEIRVSARKMFETLVESAFPNQKMTIKPMKSGKKAAFKEKAEKAPSPIEKGKTDVEDMKKEQPIPAGTS